MRRIPLWLAKLQAVLFVIFCFEMGVFLLIFPWIESWEFNYFAWLEPATPQGVEWARWWRMLWLNAFFRGAVSGLGLLNVYIAVREIFRLRRFHPEPQDVGQAPVPIE